MLAQPIPKLTLFPSHKHQGCDVMFEYLWLQVCSSVYCADFPSIAGSDV